VRRFLKDLNLTLNYLRAPFPHKHMICTTNLLERFFREFRSCADEIGCFASQDQAETLFYLILQREKAKYTNSRFVAAISISRTLCCVKRAARYGNRGYI